VAESDGAAERVELVLGNAQLAHAIDRLVRVRVRIRVRVRVTQLAHAINGLVGRR